MKQLFLMVDDGSVRLVDVPAPSPKPGYVIVETLWSVVSAGTERTLASFGSKNLVSKALERPDQVKKVLEKLSTDGLVTTMEAAFNKLGEPMPMGYSAVGRVVSCGKGVTDVFPGDLVAMAGQAYHAEANRVNRNLVAKLPEGFADPRQAAFCALGGIALQGIHQANVQPGETVAVVGMGLIGHVCARILDAYGCDVIGYDVSDKTMEGTRLKSFISSLDDNAAELTMGQTQGRGVDKVIITAATDSNAPMDLAAAIARDRATICMIGVTKMDIDRRPYYQKELTFTIARSYGAGRYDVSYEEKGVDYPIGYVRFTEGRNIEEFVRLLHTGRLDLSDLVTHEIPFDDAEVAYEMITTNKTKERYIGILLKYPEREGKLAATVGLPKPAKKAAEGSIGVGLVGGGSFARGTIVPGMKGDGRYAFKALATTGGASTGQTAANAEFSYVTSDYSRLLEDPEIDLVVVSTGHSSHARITVEALEAGKSVYCEKPLCLTLDELEAVEDAYRKSDAHLFCGMNRRHAPCIAQVKEELHTDEAPAVYDYIVNAGEIPADHWTQDAEVGGGRIIGEACHMVDVIQSLDGSAIDSLEMTFADSPAHPCKDNALVTMRMASGAIASIVYTSAGSKKYPKEQLRVFGAGNVYEMNNYVSLTRYSNARKSSPKLRQDKGFASEYDFMFKVLIGEIENKAIEDAFEGHRMLLEALNG